MVQAEEYLQQNQPDKAIAGLEPTRPYELGAGPRSAGFMPNHLRGSAYLKLHDGVKAAAEFQRILDHQGVTAWDLAYPLARLNLGRAFALRGERQSQNCLPGLFRCLEGRRSRYAPAQNG